MPADWQGVKGALNRIEGVESARLDGDGTLLVEFRGRLIKGMMDYAVVAGSPAGNDEVDMQVAGDLNGDGTIDYVLVYPSGDRQNLFVYP